MYIQHYFIKIIQIYIKFAKLAVHLQIQQIIQKKINIHITFAIISTFDKKQFFNLQKYLYICTINKQFNEKRDFAIISVHMYIQYMITHYIYLLKTRPILTDASKTTTNHLQFQTKPHLYQPSKRVYFDGYEFI